MRGFILSLIFKSSAAFLSVILVIFCGGDSCPEHHKTIFEGWERPVFPSATQPIEECDTEFFTREAGFELLTEYLCETELSISETEPLEPSETFNEENPTLPSIVIEKAERSSEENEYSDTVVISNLPADKPFALLLILSTEKNDSIYGVYEQQIPEGLNFSTFIYEGEVGVLIDGKMINEIKEQKIIFQVLIKTPQNHAPEIFVKYHEYIQDDLFCHILHT